MYLTINRLAAQARTFVSRNSMKIATLLFLAYIAGCVVIMTTTSSHVSVTSIGVVTALGIVGAIVFYLPPDTPFRGTVSMQPLFERLSSERRNRFKRHVNLKDHARKLLEPHRMPYRREFHNGDVSIIIEDTSSDCDGWDATFKCSMRVTTAADYWLTKHQFMTTYEFTIQPGKFPVKIGVTTDLLNGMQRSTSTDALKISHTERRLLRQLKHNAGPFDEDQELKRLVRHLESFGDFSEIFLGSKS